MVSGRGGGGPGGGGGDVGCGDTWAAAGQAKMREMLISWIFLEVGAHVPTPGHVSRGARARTSRSTERSGCDH